MMPERAANRRNLNRRQFGLAACALAMGGGRLFGQEPATQIDANDEMGFEDIMNLFTKTGGGKQFWADIWFFHQWRIQRNALTGHHRLLDGSDHRHNSGTFDECRKAIDAIRARDKLQPMKGRAVVVLHGLFRTRSAMQPLCDAIEKGGDFHAFNVGYPTTRGSVAAHAASLDSVIRSLEGITEINFVGHSLGNLVVRHWIGDVAAGNRKLPPGLKLGRMVMLAPPNKRPQIATTLLDNELAGAVAGAAAEELASGWNALEPKLATPTFEFGILAGGKADGRGFNPLLPGDDDAVITVESTRLVGARDFRTLPLLHSFFMHDARAQELTLRFLTHGHFETDATRQPVM